MCIIFVINLTAIFFILKIKIVCYLHHDQLKAVFHVSTRIRKAVSIMFILLRPLLVQFKWFYLIVALLVPLAIFLVIEIMN
jgi:hypothetical protein